MRYKLIDAQTNKISWNEYYAQFVSDKMRETVLERLGQKTIDEYGGRKNEIPDYVWGYMQSVLWYDDNYPHHLNIGDTQLFKHEMQEAGDVDNKSNRINVLRCAAEMLAR